MKPSTWRTAVENPTNSLAVARVGLETYRDSVGESYDPDRESWVGLIDIVAKLLCLSFSKSTPEEMMDLRDCLEGRGPFVEPAIWEPGLDSVAHHLVVEEALLKRRNTTLLEL